MKFTIRRRLFRLWYWYVNKVDRDAEIVCMNYGYSHKDQQVALDEQDRLNRYSIQLYHHLASATEIKHKDILEIGCGRGGGLYYIARNFSPASATGVDLNREAVAFCNRNFKSDGLSFLQGDAQNLKLKNRSCDVVFNIESSHRYRDMKGFLGEVYRILRPGGYFLFTDFRYDHEMDEMKKALESSGMTVLKERVINQEILAALALDDERKRKLVKKLAPKFLHKLALNFAGTIGSETYDRFLTHRYIYFSYVLMKQ
ncbi:MAG: class I SAM-dependent methyltransferase [Bacteroidetes bacterium]|nr:MAG: class I SAM-dependent methyltransferase [Bacteroidota bacterium]